MFERTCHFRQRGMIIHFWLLFWSDCGRAPAVLVVGVMLLVVVMVVRFAVAGVLVLFLFCWHG